MSRMGISRLVRFLVNFSEVYAMSFAKRMRGIAILFCLGWLYLCFFRLFRQYDAAEAVGVG